MTRREWLVAAGALAVGAGHRLEAASDAGPTFCFFSKHLPDLGWTELGTTVRDMGFGGVDLTVRPKGHVEPARVTDDLPRAVEAIRAAGIAVPMITTAVTSATDPATRAIFAAAARVKVPLIKLGYWHYALDDVRKEVAAVGRDLAALAPLAREHGVTLGFHNHADYIGAAIWDIAPHIDPLDETAIGYYYDPRHAVVEGGGRMWKVAFNRVQPRLKMVAIKDFYWERQATGWRVHDCPMGEGMVDWPWFAGALARAKFTGPISLHLEYEIPGRTAAERQARTIDHARRDLDFMRRALAGAPRTM
jgi:sugar phosphate isomerase/epimerase